MTGDSVSALRLKLEQGRIAFLSPRSQDEMLISDSGLGGIMRRLALWSSAPLFVVTFGAIYLSFRSSAPAVRGAVGSGFFLCTSLLLLWKELALSSAAKEEFGLDRAEAAERAVERIQMASSPALAAELPSNTIAAAAEAGAAKVSLAVDLPSAA